MKYKYYHNILSWQLSTFQFVLGLCLVVATFFVGNNIASFLFNEMPFLQLFSLTFPFLLALGAFISFFNNYLKIPFSQLLYANQEQKFDKSRFIFGFITWFFIQIVIETGIYCIDPSHYSFNFRFDTAFIFLLISALIFIPFQAAFEEIITRSYILQFIFQQVKNPWFAMFATALIFALLHISNPEIGSYGKGMMLLYYFMAGTLMGLLAILDGRMELNIGMHVSNNLYTAIVVGYGSSAFGTNTLVTITELNIKISLLGFVIAGILLVFICNLKYKWFKFY